MIPNLKIFEIFIIIISGDPQLIAYMEELAENPQRFTEPFNKDNGETYLHFLAKEGKLEILQRLLEDPQQQQQYLVNGLLCQVWYEN